MMHSILKNLLLIALMMVGVAGLNAQTQKISDPVAYNDFIVEQQNMIGGQLLNLIAMFDALPEDQQVIFDQLELVITTAKNSIAAVQDLKPISKEFGVKQKAIDLFQFYERIMDVEYRQVIVEFYKTEPDMELLQTILQKIQTEEAGYDQAFQSAQKSFAEEHNIELQENELQQELDGEGEGE